MPNTVLDQVPTAPQSNTYLTSCEWRIVDMSTEYAKHCLEGKPFYDFPYFRQVATLWAIFGESFKAAQKHDKATDIIFSANMAMNLFVSVFTSFEFLAKGLLNLPAAGISALAGKQQNNTPFQQKVGEVAKEYVDLIKDDAFYTVPYLAELGSLYKSFYNAESRSVIDAYTLFALSFEHLAKSLISMPFWGFYKLSELITSDDSYWQRSLTIAYPAGCDDATKTHLKQELATQVSEKINPGPNTHYQDEIDFLEEEGEFLRIKCGRYDNLQEAIKILSELGFTLHKFEGNDFVQLRVKDTDCESLKSEKVSALCKDGITQDYSYKNSIDANTTFFSLDVPVTRLQALNKDLDKEDAPSTHWLHDF